MQISNVVPLRPSVLAQMADRAAGTLETLQLMRRIVDRYKVRTDLREIALAVVSDLPNRDFIGEASAVYRYVRDHIRYTRDVVGVETIQTPDVTLELAAGDCDDHSTLVATLLESIGHPTRFVAVGWRGPDTYSHVYAEALVRGCGWVGLDTTAPRSPGWKPTPPTARLVVE